MKYYKWQKVLIVSSLAIPTGLAGESWVVDRQEEWEKAVAKSVAVDIEDGVVVPSAGEASIRSVMKTFPEKISATSLTIGQSPVWENWNPVENLGPSNLGDAPVMLSLGPGNYWMFGRYGGFRKKGKAAQNFVAEDATLEGFDVPLKTTPFANQFNAPGGLKKGKGGYHAWQSRDMKTWVHHGAITESFARWMTTAEYVDGKAYFYYDFPNDQDPHVYVDDDLFDGEPGENKGLAFADPSHGSDCAVIRDLDGKFHIVAEDWSPIKAQTRSWDSPLATRGVSEDGLAPFKVATSPPVDERTTPTGKIGTYKHPHWAKEDPKNYTSGMAEYEIHEPEQEAYGDWAAISIGGQYYLFGDYDPAGGHKMSVCWFTASSIEEKFEFCGKIGDGHPDPDIMFAEGQFYLATQQKTDWVSPGPWVEGVEVRVGVDTSKDGKVDQWTDWQELKESYDYVPGFSKQVKREPARLDLSGLPAGFGFQYEIRLKDTTENKSKPMLDRVVVEFGG